MWSEILADGDCILAGDFIYPSLSLLTRSLTTAKGPVQYLILSCEERIKACAMVISANTKIPPNYRVIRCDNCDMVTKVFKTQNYPLLL